MYFLQFYSLLLNCEKQYLKLINRELYEMIERFWRHSVLSICYCGPCRNEPYLQVPVEVGHQQKKEYLANQLNTLQQNTENKEKQLKNLQMSAKEQIGKEV